MNGIHGYCVYLTVNYLINKLILESNIKYILGMCYDFRIIQY